MSQLGSITAEKEKQMDLERQRFQEVKAKMLAQQKYKRAARTAGHIVLNIVVALIVLLPLLYAVSIAFMPSGELFTLDMNILPKHPTLENFRQALQKVPLVRFVVNSFLVAGLITFGQIISCSLAAFSFSFLDFKGKNVLFMLVMATMMIPGEATIISNYLTVSGWNWLDSYQVLIVPYLTSAMGIFLFRQFYLTFPISLYESAKIDGCSNLRFIWQILMPLTKSAMGARLLKNYIDRPLLKKEAIEERLDIVEIFTQQFIQRESIKEILKEIYDLERLSSRIAFGNINARDLKWIASSLKVLPELKQQL